MTYSTTGITRQQAVRNVLLKNRSKFVPVTSLMYPFSKDDNRTVVAEHRRPLTALRREYPHLKIENFQITIDGEIHSYYRLDTAEKDLRVARHRFCLKQYGHIESVKASLEKLKKEIQK